uniref:Uncharacterized protein n=1 Tax=Rhizophora mucronata TaxID=61149 RepID=A0A2P2IPX6_RHIMU
MSWQEHWLEGHFSQLAFRFYLIGWLLAKWWTSSRAKNYKIDC